MLHRFGTSYGGFYYPKDLDGLDKDSIVYCVGAGEDITHDVEIAHKLCSDIYLFDPTPRAIEHVKYVKDLFAGDALPVPDTRFGGGDPKYLDIIMEHKIEPSRIHMHDFGLFTKDTDIKFYKPTNETGVSHSVVHGMKGDKYINVQVKKLTTIMKELGHTHIDLLKIDIEGCECDVLEQMIRDNIKPKYLSVDFDLGWHGERIRDQRRCFEIIELLMRNGYKLLHHDGSDFSFMLMS